MSRRHCTGLSPSKTDSHEDDNRLHRHPGVSLAGGCSPTAKPPPTACSFSPLREERTPASASATTRGSGTTSGWVKGARLLQLVMRLEGCGLAEAIRRLGKGSADEVPLSAPPDRLAARRLPVADSRRRGDSPPGADRLSARARHRPLPWPERCAARFTTSSASGASSPSASATMPEAGSCAARSSRGSSAPKSITTFDRHGDTALLFEGFFDLLSHLTLQHESEPTADTAVLNSVVNLPCPSFSRTPRDDPRLPRQRRGGAPHPRTAAQRLARCNHYRPGGELPSPQGSERIAPIVREGFPHAGVVAAASCNVTRNDAETVAHPSAASRPRLSPEEKAIVY